MKEFQHQDYGTINFGNIHNGKKWNDPSVTIKWLEYIVSDDCNTLDINKEIARKELQQRRLCQGQGEFNF